MEYGEYVWDRGALRQRCLTPTVVYDRAYLETRYAAIDANVRTLSAKRLRVLEVFVTPSALLDFGCGTGRFVEAARKHGWHAAGYDLVHPWNAAGTLTAQFDVVTFFDSLEHLVDPAGIIQSLAPAWLMISVPWCHYPDKEWWFIPWRHRRPGEHLWHFSRDGLDEFLSYLGYTPLMHSSFEDEWRVNAEQREANILTAIYRKTL